MANTPIMTRWIGFILAILVGAAVAMVYGWVISPVEYVDTPPELLRVDYKSDYVLMVAEAYSLENDLAQAVRRLSFLGSESPAEIVRQAILFAEREGVHRRRREPDAQPGAQPGNLHPCPARRVAMNENRGPWYLLTGLIIGIGLD